LRVAASSRSPLFLIVRANCPPNCPPTFLAYKKSVWPVITSQADVRLMRAIVP
jgi:hypothetical protein